MPIIPPIAPAPTIQIFTKWFLITKDDWSAHRSRAGYPGFRKGALTSCLVLDRGEARRKVGLEEATVHPDFVIPLYFFLSGHMSGRAAGEQKQGLFWRTIRAAHVVRRKRMHQGMIALEPATLPARRARGNPWFSLRHSLIQIHVIGFIAFRPIPGMPRGGVLPPTPVFAPGSALGSRPRVALSSAQVTSV